MAEDLVSPRRGARDIVVVGPTASGKTELAVALARLVGGEVVSVDSRQIYKELHVGTAKPPGRWGLTDDGRRAYFVRGVAHHLVDFLDPKETFDAARFAALAGEAVRGIRAAGKVPILAGGSGMYLQAYFNGLDPLPPRAPELRSELERELAAKGAAALSERLRASDAGSADWAGANPRRLVRALEVLALTGRPIREQWTGAFLKDLPTDRALFVGLQWEPATLDSRIEARTRALWPMLLEECGKLLASGRRAEEPGLKTLGYPEALSVVRGEKTAPEALDRLLKGTKRYARRQRSWFKRYAAIRWAQPHPGLEEEILEWRRAP